MTADPHGLRALADAQRRGADRLTLLRLRLANTLAQAARAEEPEVREIGEQVHERWTREEHPELGLLVTVLRAAAKQLDQEAVRAERLSGRRMGGYTGAGFLGRGREASRHVHEVAAVVVFLLSDAASYVTGAEIAVDGGASSQGGAKTVSDALLTTYQPPEKH